MALLSHGKLGLNADLVDNQHASDFGTKALEHVAVTLGGGSDAALSLSGQVLTLANVLTPTEHSAIGNGAPHHKELSLGDTADEILGWTVPMVFPSTVQADQQLNFTFQEAHLVLAGPAVTGAAAAPTFRALTVADVPDAINVRTVTATTTETATDGLIVCDKSTAMTVNLLAATGSGRAREIASIGVGVVTVDANGAETISGETTQALRQGDAVQIRDYASGKWVII